MGPKGGTKASTLVRACLGTSYVDVVKAPSAEGDWLDTEAGDSTRSTKHVRKNDSVLTSLNKFAQQGHASKARNDDFGIGIEAEAQIDEFDLIKFPRFNLILI